MSEQPPVPALKIADLTFVIVFLLLIAGGAGQAAAQRVDDARVVGIGTVIRVGLAAEPNLAPYPRTVRWLRGTIHSIRPDTLFLVPTPGTDVIPIPRLMITDIQESLGVNRWVSARQVGFGLAFFNALVIMALQESVEDGKTPPFRSSAVAYSAAAGGGFAVGFLIGAIRPSERWRIGWLPE
jgi:hypothetical protein